MWCSCSSEPRALRFWRVEPGRARVAAKEACSNRRPKSESRRDEIERFLRERFPVFRGYREAATFLRALSVAPSPPRQTERVGPERGGL